MGGEEPQVEPTRLEGRAGGLRARLDRLARRAGTGFALAFLAVALIWAGTLPFTLLALGFCLVGLSEYYDLAERKGCRPARRLGALAVSTLVLGAWLRGPAAVDRLALLWLLATLLLSLFGAARRGTVLMDAAVTVLGFLYVGWLPAHLVLLRGMESVPGLGQGPGPGGAFLVFWLMSICAFTDVGAYFFGKGLGRTPLCPSISPAKTVEGSLGGVLVAVLAGWFLGRQVGVEPIHCLALPLLGTVCSQLGDLWESALKRDAGVKDSGRLLESHGGVLDRFDSYLVAAPLYHVYLTWLVG